MSAVEQLKLGIHVQWDCCRLQSGHIFSPIGLLCFSDCDIKIHNRELILILTNWWHGHFTGGKCSSPIKKLKYSRVRTLLSIQCCLGVKLIMVFSSDSLCCVDSRQTVFIYAFLLIICLLAFYLYRFDDNKAGLCKKIKWNSRIKEMEDKIKLYTEK